MLFHCPVVGDPTDSSVLPAIRQGVPLESARVSCTALELSGDDEISLAQDPYFISSESTSTPIINLTSSPVISGESLPASSPLSTVPFSALKLALNQRGFDINSVTEEVILLDCDVDVPPITTPLAPEVEAVMFLALGSFLGTGGTPALRNAKPVPLSPIVGTSSSSPGGPPRKSCKTVTPLGSPSSVTKPRKLILTSPSSVKSVSSHCSSVSWKTSSKAIPSSPESASRLCAREF